MNPFQVENPFVLFDIFARIGGEIDDTEVEETQEENRNGK